MTLNAREFEFGTEFAFYIHVCLIPQEIFDPSLKKKTKKKKTTFDPDLFGDADKPKEPAADSMPAGDAVTEDKSVTQGTEISISCFIV